MEKLLTAEQIADLLGVSTKWVRNEARKNKLPHFKVGKYLRFDRGEVLTSTRSSNEDLIKHY